MASERDLTVVIPCFNPPEHWEQNLSTNLQNVSTLLGFMPDVILVNDGSTKNFTKESTVYLQSLYPNFKIISYPVNKGKGYALRKGVEAAATEFVIFTDIDFPYTNKSVILIWEALKQQKDVVTGYRDESYYEKIPATRKIISKLFRGLLKVLFRLKTTDTQCGLKGFNRKGREVFLKTKTDRYLFDLEFISLSSRAKDIEVFQQLVYLDPSIEFSKMNIGILLTELFNLFKILFRKG